MDQTTGTYDMLPGMTLQNGVYVTCEDARTRVRRTIVAMHWLSPENEQSNFEVKETTLALVCPVSEKAEPCLSDQHQY